MPGVGICFRGIVVGALVFLLGPAAVRAEGPAAPTSAGPRRADPAAQVPLSHWAYAAIDGLEQDDGTQGGLVGRFSSRIPRTRAEFAEATRSQIRAPQAQIRAVSRRRGAFPDDSHLIQALGPLHSPCLTGQRDASLGMLVPLADPASEPRVRWRNLFARERLLDEFEPELSALHVRFGEIHRLLERADAARQRLEVPRPLEPSVRDLAVLRGFLDGYARGASGHPRLLGRDGCGRLSPQTTLMRLGYISDARELAEWAWEHETRFGGIEFTGGVHQRTQDRVFPGEFEYLQVSRPTSDQAGTATVSYSEIQPGSVHYPPHGTYRLTSEAGTWRVISRGRWFAPE